MKLLRLIKVHVTLRKVVCLKKKRDYWQDHLKTFFPNDFNEHKESCL